MFQMLLSGNLFEVFFMSFMIYKTKDLHKKFFLLFLGITFIYFISGALINFTYNNQYIFYILFNLLTFALLKVLYKKKTQVLDIFIIYYFEMILNFSSLICMKIFEYSMIAFYINRAVLIFICCFHKKFAELYQMYIKNWNRKDGNKIKAITVRNISIIAMNLTLYIINWYLVNYLQKLC